MGQLRGGAVPGIKEGTVGASVVADGPGGHLLHVEEEGVLPGHGLILKPHVRLLGASDGVDAEGVERDGHRGPALTKNADGLGTGALGKPFFRGHPDGPADGVVSRASRGNGVRESLLAFHCGAYQPPAKPERTRNCTPRPWSMASTVPVRNAS